MLLIVGGRARRRSRDSHSTVWCRAATRSYRQDEGSSRHAERLDESYRWCGPAGSSCSHGAAKESNLPSGGLLRPAGFEDRMGHQAHATPLASLEPKTRLQAGLMTPLPGRLAKVPARLEHPEVAVELMRLNALVAGLQGDLPAPALARAPLGVLEQPPPDARAASALSHDQVGNPGLGSRVVEPPSEMQRAEAHHLAPLVLRDKG